MLGSRRQIFSKELSLVVNRAGEAGGIVSYVKSSGVEVVGYIADISCSPEPIGVQLHGIEHMDQGFQYHPWQQRGMRRVSQPGDPVGIATKCIVDTNFVHPSANPHSGKKAYLAPSGLITDDASLGGPQIGYFHSSLNDASVPGLPNKIVDITIYGGGFVRGSYMKKVGRGKFEIQEPSIENITLTSPGWVRVKIEI